MRTIILILCCVGILSACTQQDVINSGVSSPYHDCNMMDYMRGDTYNWELTVQMIEHAGLTDLFEGKVGHDAGDHILGNTFLFHTTFYF